MTAFAQKVSMENTGKCSRLMLHCMVRGRSVAQRLFFCTAAAKQEGERRMLGKKPKETAKVVLLELDFIQPSPFQARRHFDQQELESLAGSIVRNGLLQPISVRRLEKNKYELIAGERRLRAAKLAGLERIPAIITEHDDLSSAVLGLEENTQRQQLNCFEQARGLRELIRLWDCTQAEAAKRLGMAQPTLANKLRLLVLTDAQQQLCLEGNLTERHARAVLALEDAEKRTAVLEQAARRQLTVQQTEQLVQKLLLPPTKARRSVMVRDVRVFLNTVNHAIQVMVQAGIPATATKKEEEGYIEYTVRIPTHPGT